MSYGGQPNPFILLPIPGMGGQQLQYDERVPRRVLVAMEMLDHLARKTMTRVAVNDVSTHEIEGQKLDVEERHVFASSCNLLVKYLDGDYKPTKEEKALEQSANKVKSVTTIIRCAMCGGSGRVSSNPCPLCLGTGYLSVTPANPEGD